MQGSYDRWGNFEPSNIYLARPGQRIINGAIGIREDTCRLEKNFNNTSVLEFTVDRDIDGTVNPVYEYYQQLFELYVPKHGWFKINEEPVIETDGNVETKSVRAESLEIELQQYDIVDFEVNTASVSSKEMLAVDNKFLYNDYYAYHDRVVLYRDTSRYQELADIFRMDENSTVEDLRRYLYYYPELENFWRLDFDYDRLDADLQSAADHYRSLGRTSTAEYLEGKINTIHKGDEDKKAQTLEVTATAPLLRQFIHITFNVKHEDPDNPLDQGEYTIQEVLDMEVQRMKELSLLTILLEDHGWSVGTIDPSVRINSLGQRVPLAYENGQFQVDTQDLYSFITQDLASYFQCIFFFDTENYKVNAYRIESIGLDTNVYLSFHNIQNSVTRNSDKQIYTVFNVLGGDDLHIDEANFGESWIEDISYFLNTDHFTQDFIDKYHAWQEYRDGLYDGVKSRREDYMQLSIRRRKALEVANEIYDRVPLDITNTYQYNTMSDAELVEEYNRYSAMLEGYRHKYVDENGVYIGDEAFARDYPRDYSDYAMILNEVIGPDPEHPGNLQIAIDNRHVDSASDTRDYLDGWEFNFDAYGNSYGVAELKAKITTLNNQINALKSKGFDNEPTEQGDAYGQNQHNLYLKYTRSLAEAESALAQRTNEYDTAYGSVIDYGNQMNALKTECSITNPYFGFSDDEVWLLERYRIHTDYTNENIITTSISDAYDLVKTAYELYLDAKEQLSAESQPQWNFETTQDNLLLMPEFKGWHSQLEVGNFVRVSMREDFQVKLRVVSIAFNPFLLEPTIDLQFSNMVQYSAKRNDFINLLQNGRSSSKNQISSSLTSSGGNGDINISSDFLLKLFNNGVFNSFMNSQATDIGGTVISGVTASTISAVSGQIGDLVTTNIRSATIYADQIDGSEGRFEKLYSDYIDANYIAAQVIDADEGYIKELFTNAIQIGDVESGLVTIANGAIQAATISADQINATDGKFQTLVSNTIEAIDIKGENITVDEALINNILRVGADGLTQLTEDTITTGNLIANTIEAQAAEIGEILSDHIVATQIDANAITADHLEANAGAIGNLLSDYITAKYIDANAITAQHLTANAAQIGDLLANYITAQSVNTDNLFADTGFISHFQSLWSSTATSVVGEQYIQNAIINKVTAAQLKAGTLELSDEMVISSIDGGMIINGEGLQITSQDNSMILDDTGLQFLGKTKDEFGNDVDYVGIQLGYDAENKPSLILRNGNNHLILDTTGITKDAVADDLIVGRMIDDRQITVDHLDFNIYEQVEGTLIEQIHSGQGLFGAEWTSFSSAISSNSEALSSISQELEDSATYTIHIETPDGINAQGTSHGGTLRLVAHVFRNGVDVTNDVDNNNNYVYGNECFTWTRNSANTANDQAWNNLNKTGRILEIDGTDIDVQTTFQCCFTYTTGNNSIEVNG